jgi:hypothetical protein
VGKNYKHTFRDIYLISNHNIKNLKTISFPSLVLISLKYRIQTDREKQNTKKLAKNLLNFFLVYDSYYLFFDTTYFILIFTQIIIFSNIFFFLY